MLDFCKDLISLFLLPFQEFFIDSVFGSVFYIFLVFVPVIFILKIWRKVV